MYLDAPKEAMLGGYVDGTVTILVHFIQGDALFLHKLKKPKKNFFLQTQRQWQLMDYHAASLK